MTWLFFQAVVSGLLLGGVYGLVASGLSLIFGVLRIINFAHGAVMMLGMYTSYWLFVLLGVDPYLSILVTGPLFFGIGVLIQRIVIEPNRAAAEHNQLLLTLGLALFFENLALVLWQGDFRTVRVAYSGASFMVADVLVEVPRLIAAGGAVLIALALWAFLRLTDAGKAIRALSEEAEGAMLVGIDVSRIRAVAFGIGSACVAVAGALVTPFFYVAPDVGESFNIMAFVVVVLGGHGQFSGRPPRRLHRGPGRIAGRRVPARLPQAARGLRPLRDRAALASRGAVRRRAVAARLAIALALALLVAVPPLLPKYALEVLISILFFGLPRRLLEHPRRLRRAVLVRPRRLLRDRGLHLHPALPPARAHALARHGGGRGAGRRVRPLRGVPLVSLRAARARTSRWSRWPSRRCSGWWR